MPNFRSALCKRLHCRNPVAALALPRISPTSLSTCSASPWTSPRRNLSQKQEVNHDLIGPTFQVPADRVAWDDSTVREALDKVWFHINKNKAKDAPDRGIEDLEKLLDLQLLQSEKVVEHGVVINMLRHCQRRKLSDVSSLDRLERILEKLQRIDHLRDEKNISLVLLAMTSCRHASNDGPQRAEKVLLNQIENPQNYHYGAILNGYAQRGMAEQATRLLQHMEEQHSKGFLTNGPPNTRCYICVINAFAKKGGRDAPTRADAIFRRMENNPEVQPDAESFSSLLNCYSRFCLANKAEKLLQQMEERYKAGLLDEGPNTTVFTQVLNILARSGARDAPQRAEALFNRMLELHTEGNPQVQPDEYTCSAMLKCYSNHRNVQGAYRFLERMHELHASNQLMNGPSTSHYNALLRVLAMSRESDAAQRAEAILNLLHEMHSKGHPHMKPDWLSYSIVLDCCAQQGMAEKAISLLQQMHDHYNTGNIKNGPNTSCYNCAINSLANSKNNSGAPELAKALVYRMQLYAVELPSVQPDVITFNSLLKVYMKAGMVDEAQETLQEMHKLNKAGDLRDGPDVASYRCVIKMLADTRTPDYLSRAEELLDEMIESHLATKHLAEDPESKIFTILMNGYANAGMSREAEELLQKMYQLHISGLLKRKPNRIAHNCVVKALKNSLVWDAPERAEAIVARMREHRIDPCVITYNSLLNIYAQEGMVRESEQTLQKMIDLHKKGKLKGGPDTTSYSMVLNALAKGGGREACQKAEELLERMKEGDSKVKPDSGTILSFLFCFERCGKLEEGKRILEQLR